MNSFFGLGPMELFLIVFIALIVLGPQRLPGTIREVMKYWRYFRNLSGELTSQLGEEFKDLEDLNPQKMIEGFAKELDDEMERTQEAAGIKKTKKPASSKYSSSKSSTTKPAAVKSSSAKTSTTKTSNAKPATSASSADNTKNDASTTSKPETDVEPVKNGESVAEESAIAGAAAAGVAAGDQLAKNGDIESKPATNASKETESNERPLAELERSIMAPPATVARSDGDQPVDIASSNAQSDPVATDTKTKASSAKTSVNGAAKTTEDEG